MRSFFNLSTDAVKNKARRARKALVTAFTTFGSGVPDVSVKHLILLEWWMSRPGTPHSNLVMMQPNFTTQFVSLLEHKIVTNVLEQAVHTSKRWL